MCKEQNVVVQDLGKELVVGDVDWDAVDKKYSEWRTKREADINTRSVICAMEHDLRLALHCALRGYARTEDTTAASDEDVASIKNILEIRQMLLTIRLWKSSVSPDSKIMDL